MVGGVHYSVLFIYGKCRYGGLLYITSYTNRIVYLIVLIIVINDRLGYTVCLGIQSGGNVSDNMLGLFTVAGGVTELLKPGIG